MELPVELLFLLSLISSVIVWVLKIAFVKKGKEVPAWVYTVGVYAIAFVLALLFSPVSLPPFPPFVDLPSFILALLAYVGEVLPVVSALVGFATLIYNALKDKILDGLGDAIRGLFKSPEPEDLV